MLFEFILYGIENDFGIDIYFGVFFNVLRIELDFFVVGKIGYVFVVFCLIFGMMRVLSRIGSLVIGFYFEFEVKIDVRFEEILLVVFEVGYLK